MNMTRCRMKPFQALKVVVVAVAVVSLSVLMLLYSNADIHAVIGWTRANYEAKTHVSKMDKRQHELIRERFRRRLKYLQDRCKSIERSAHACPAPDMTDNIKQLRNNNLVFCTIEKTGSTLFKRILHVAGGWTNSTNPLSIRSRDTDIENGGFVILWNATSDEMQDIFERSESVMFVRNPLSRLFSAWLDKFYSTNPYYWKSFGRRIIKQQRMFASNDSVTCGSDVTFPEFVRFIVNEVQEDDVCADGHFTSSYSHCLPCNFTYRYIGKFETMKEDTYFILEEFNLTDKVTFAGFETSNEADIMLDAAEWVFQKRTDIIKCMPFGCGLFRVWKRLQIQGILWKNATFPYKTLLEADAVTVSEFGKAITDAYVANNRDERKYSRQEVLLEVYRSLSPATWQRLLDTFSDDFELFEYSKDPQYFHDTFLEEFTYFEQCPFSFSTD